MYIRGQEREVKLPGPRLILRLRNNVRTGMYMYV